MHVGLAAVFQNPKKTRSDYDVYRNELRLADQAEPLGFESIWGVEHHFTDYTMCPDVLQFLTFMAGRTRRVRLGSMVVVLPWHDPLRVAEQVAMLDNMADGRLIFGIGRGLGRVEFNGFRVAMEESRPRFIESAEMVLRGLETGFCEYDGTFVKQPRTPIRPKPSRTFRGRTYAAAVSPESMRIMAELGVGILIIPQKPWDIVTDELAQYRAAYREVNGADPLPTVCAGWTFCDEDAGRARELAVRYIGGYWDSVLRHYELARDHLKHTKGYEYYGRMSEIAQEKGGVDALTEFFLNLQVWGTPEQCYERIVDIRSRVGCDTYVAAFRYAGMPPAEAERNIRLFAREVLPELKRLDEPAGTGRAEPAVPGAPRGDAGHGAPRRVPLRGGRFPPPPRG
jgi:alkanesulfonate monooxygenase SsuD/methylene tetrahydromethanopterin reductase-like flavin-dependent oxidoreductase (luciferase family)